MSKAEDRKCNHCSVILTDENSWVSRSQGRRQGKCKVCSAIYRKEWVSKNRKKERARAKKYYAENKHRLIPVYEKSRLRRKYGVTPEKLVQMKAVQSGLCLICLSSRAVCIDHDHDTGSTRALLCHKCNTSIGMLGEDPARLIRASQYLIAWSSKGNCTDGTMDTSDDLLRIVTELKKILSTGKQVKG